MNTWEVTSIIGNIVNLQDDNGWTANYKIDTDTVAIESPSFDYNNLSLDDQLCVDLTEIEAHDKAVEYLNIPNIQEKW